MLQVRFPITLAAVVLLSNLTQWIAHANPSCVLSVSGKMLCCAANDLECLAKVQKAHAEPDPSAETSPPVLVNPAEPRMLSLLYTFGNTSVWDRSSPFDVIVVGVPFGLESGYEAPGLQLVRRLSSHAGSYSMLYGASMQDLVVVDGQDLVVTGLALERLAQLEAVTAPMFAKQRPVIAMGGDQFITYALTNVAKSVIGEFAIVHIDKDLSIGMGSREQGLGSTSALFWGAAKSLFDTRHSLHLGQRGNLPSQRVHLIDQELGFETITAEDIALKGIREVLDRVRARLQRRDGTFMPAYISLDLDVLEPHAFPSAEVGGLTVTQLRAMLGGMRPFCRVVGADLRDVAMLEDPATAQVAATILQDLVLLSGIRPESAVTSPPIKPSGTGSEL
mmetsp:Transcript_51619/g.122850  ORF Transcript_51619/g.122850 Transcript_51619/m.122850 type:complete len:391 (+) Transcript_51619:113-1285(+)